MIRMLWMSVRLGMIAVCLEANCQGPADICNTIVYFKDGNSFGQTRLESSNGLDIQDMPKSAHWTEWARFAADRINRINLWGGVLSRLQLQPDADQLVCCDWTELTSHGVR